MTVDEVSQKRSVRDDPAHDGRRLVVFFVALVVTYVGAVLVLRPGEGDLSTIAVPVMFAPTIGALAAVLLAHGRIQLGRPTKHLLLAFVPPLVILVTTWAAATFTSVEVSSGRLGPVLALAVYAALSGAVSAVGEEIGWRGFLWPLFRRHRGFWASALLMLPVWLVYHLPAVLLWGYGFVAGLPAFTVAIFGFILFVGVLTERSRGIWASVLTHGAWNGMVATAFFAGTTEPIPTCTDSGCPDFTAAHHLFAGPQTLLGEFGWITAVSMLAIGVVAALWHLRHPVATTVSTD